MLHFVRPGDRARAPRKYASVAVRPGPIDSVLRLTATLAEACAGRCPRMAPIKISDEFTVSVCRTHQRKIHRHCSERARWHKTGLALRTNDRWRISGPMRVSDKSQRSLSGMRIIPRIYTRRPCE